MKFTTISEQKQRILCKYLMDWNAEFIFHWLQQDYDRASSWDGFFHSYSFLPSEWLISFAQITWFVFRCTQGRHSQQLNGIILSHDLTRQNSTESVVCVVLTSLLITLQVTIFAKSSTKVLLHVLLSTTTKTTLWDNSYYVVQKLSYNLYDDSIVTTVAENIPHHNITALALPKLQV